MGDDNKIAAITLFVVTIIEGEKNDGNKLVVIAHFRFKQKKRGAMVANLLSSPCLQQKIKK
jgi:hypothetical protein